MVDEAQVNRNLLGNAAGAIADHVPWMPSDTKPADAIRILAAELAEVEAARDEARALCARYRGMAFGGRDLPERLLFPWEVDR
jgi:hypothetical protein